MVAIVSAMALSVLPNTLDPHDSADSFLFERYDSGSHFILFLFAARRSPLPPVPSYSFFALWLAYFPYI